MEEDLLNELFELADEDYRRFSSSLLPDTERLIGVRLPELRRIARRIARQDWRRFMTRTDGIYFEEAMLQAMVLGYVKADTEELLEKTANFIPHIRNWAVCDSLCSGLKLARRHSGRIWDFLQPYLFGQGEYEVRFGVVTLLNYYIDEVYLEGVLHCLDQIRHEAYYAQMAVAWALSICYVRFPARTLAYLQGCGLDDFTYRKTLQKIIESRRVDPQEKEVIRQLKHMRP